MDKELDREAFSGTLLVRGKGYLEITRTGAESAMGKLATMIGGIETSKTPLEQRLEVFGNQIAKIILTLSIVLALAGLYVEGWERIGHVLLFAVALAVAAVPEGLPAVLTLTLSLGVERMAKRKAVVRRLSAVEALGSVTVIATDKTGTLTENRMFVKDLDTPDTAQALRAMVLANDAELATGAGDPLELALLEYAQQHGDFDQHPDGDTIGYTDGNANDTANQRGIDGSERSGECAEQSADWVDGSHHVGRNCVCSTLPSGSVGTRRLC